MIDEISTAGTGGLESASVATAVERRFPCLDGYRALAALAVLATHLGFATGVSLDGGSMTYLGRGDIGVPVFFVLSGFLIYRPFALATARGVAQPRTAAYLWRRALRVLPAYWVAVALALTLLAVNAGQRSPLEWLRQLLLVQYYPAAHSLRGLSQTWSLAAEVAFYLLLPAWPRLVRMSARRIRQTPEELLALECRLCGLLVLLAFAWTIVVRATSVIPLQGGLWLPAHTDWFAIGMAAAAIDAHRRSTATPAAWTSALTILADSWATCWVFAGAVFLVICTPLVGSYGLGLLSVWQAVIKELLYGVFAAAFLLPGFFGDQRLGAGREFLRWPPLASLGRVSYGLFLLHQIVIELTLSLGGIALFSHRIGLVSLVVVPVSIAAAYASSWLVERPLLRRATRPHRDGERRQGEQLRPDADAA